MLNKTAETNAVNRGLVCVCVVFFLLVCFLLLFDFGALTSQLLPPEVLSLLFTHVE